MTDFAYGQDLLHYKKNFEEFKQKNKYLFSNKTGHTPTLAMQILF